MSKIGIIDIGSNTFNLLVFAPNKKKNYTIQRYLLALEKAPIQYYQ